MVVGAVGGGGIRNPDVRARLLVDAYRDRLPRARHLRAALPSGLTRLKTGLIPYYRRIVRSTARARWPAVASRGRVKSDAVNVFGWPTSR